MNHRPPALQAGALPLSYIKVTRTCACGWLQPSFERPNATHPMCSRYRATNRYLSPMEHLSPELRTLPAALLCRVGLHRLPVIARCRVVDRVAPAVPSKLFGPTRVPLAGTSIGLLPHPLFQLRPVGTRPRLMTGAIGLACCTGFSPRGAESPSPPLRTSRCAPAITSTRGGFF